MTSEGTAAEEPRHAEIAEGYVVDIACLRKYPSSEVASRAREHTRICSLAGHCVESGYGLVDEEGRITLLDSQATPAVLEVVRAAEAERGIRLTVRRVLEGEQMVTHHVMLAK